MSFNTSPTPDQPGRWVITKFGGPSVLKWEAQDINRELSDDEVLVRIITAGIAGVDNIQRVGGYPDPRCADPGFTPGYEFVGEVVRLASSAMSSGKFAIGDRVASMCIFGAHATHVVISSTELIRIDIQDDPIKICALPLNYMTTWGMLRRSGVDLKPGNSILIGSVSGGVGTAVAQLVRAFGMDLKMIGTCSPSKFDYAKSLGVIPIDRHASDLVDQVRSLTNGEGVDVAYDAVGSEESLQRSHYATKKHTGQVICIGVMGEIEESGNGLHNKADELLKLLSLRFPPRSSFFAVPRYSNESRAVFVNDFMAIVNKVRKGKLVPEIFKLHRLDEAVDAHQAIISGKDIRGKMIYVVDGELAAKCGIC
jgi:NADPH:quinone reductase-like Zn-dependent oxidoreductase